MTRYSTNDQWDRYDEILQYMTVLENNYLKDTNAHNAHLSNYFDDLLTQHSTYNNKYGDLANKISDIIDK